jgi:hypothetical protein
MCAKIGSVKFNQKPPISETHVAETLGGEKDTYCLVDRCPCLALFEHLYYTSLMNKTLIRTMSIKLDIGEYEAALQATQKACNAAASWIASVCWEEGIT